MHVLHILAIGTAVLSRVFSTAHSLPPLSVSYEGADGAVHTKHLPVDSSADVLLKELYDMINTFGGQGDKVLLLETLVRHYASHLASANIDGDLFLRMNSKVEALRRLEAVTAAVSGMAEGDFPSRVWTTSSPTPFQVVLDNDFMSSIIMKTESDSWIYQQLDMLIDRAGSSGGRAGVMIDVGANLGSLALYAAAKGEQVVAFEASALTARRLKASCVINGWCPSDKNTSVPNIFRDNLRFSIFENAVSDRDGEKIVMNLNWLQTEGHINRGANTMFPIGADETNLEGEWEMEMAESITLDTAMASLGLAPASAHDISRFSTNRHISLLKLDCEGCEVRTLLGSSLLFKSNPPLTIMTEVNEKRLVAAGSSPFEYMRMLETLGYDIFNQEDAALLSPVTLDSVTSLMKKTDAGMADCVAMRRS